MPETELNQTIAETIGRHGANAFAAPAKRASLLLMKRDAFQHEAEVRLIYVEQREVTPEPVFRVRCDPNEVFDEISFDPRLVPFERNEREAAIKAAGYKGSIILSLLYQGTLLQIAVSDTPVTRRTP
jgi:hypothetical protein